MPLKKIKIIRKTLQIIFIDVFFIVFWFRVFLRDFRVNFVWANWEMWEKFVKVLFSWLSSKVPLKFKIESISRQRNSIAVPSKFTLQFNPQFPPLPYQETEPPKLKLKSHLNRHFLMSWKLIEIKTEKD